MKRLVTTAWLLLATTAAIVTFNVSTVLGQQNFSQTKAIRFGKLVDGSGKVLTNAIVVVESDRIKSVSTSLEPLGRSSNRLTTLAPYAVTLGDL